MYKHQKMKFLVQTLCDYFNEYSEKLALDIVGGDTSNWTVRAVSPNYPEETFIVTFLEDKRILELAKIYKKDEPKIGIMQHLQHAIENTTKYDTETM